MSKERTLLVLTGFSGSGKDTVMNELLKSDWKRVVTHSAGREMRPNETEGVDYYFVNREEFERMVRDGEFLEHVQYGETLKGTHKREIQQKLAEHEKVIWRVEPTAGSRVEEIVRDSFSDNEAREIIETIVTIFLMADDMETTKKRAVSRNMDGNTEVVDERYESDLKMWNELRDRFENIVINHEGRLEETIREVLEIIGRKS